MPRSTARDAVGELRTRPPHRSGRGRVLGVTVIVGALLLAACGKSEAEKLVDDLSRGLRDDPAFASYEMTEDDAVCIAQTIVDSLGTDRIREIGLVDTDAELDLQALTDAEIVVVGDTIEACVPDLDPVLSAVVAESITADPDPDFPVTDEEAACVASAVIDELPLSRLIQLGLAEEQGSQQLDSLTDAEIEVFSDAFGTCVDIRAIVLSGIAESGAPEELLECLDAEISDAGLQALLAAGFRGEEPSAAAAELLTPAIETCT